MPVSLGRAAYSYKIAALGATLVSFGAPRVFEAQRAWTVSTDVRVGLADSSIHLHSVVGAVRHRDGTVVIADAHAGKLTFVRRDGTLLRQTGRQGMGPGEFQHIGWLGSCAMDSLFAWDLMRRRMLVFTHGGDFVREFSVPQDPSESWSAGAIACSKRGWLAVQAVPRKFVRTELGSVALVQGISSVRFTDGAGAVSATVNDIGGIERVVIDGGAGPRPLGMMTFMAASDSLLFIGTTDSSTILVLDPSGRRTARIAMALPSRTPRPKHAEASIEEITSQIRGGISTMISERMRRLPLPERLPKWSHLNIDPMGLLWVTVSVPGDAATDLQVFSANGDLHARVSIPQELRVLDVGVDYVLGVSRDPMGSPRIIEWRLERRN